MKSFGVQEIKKIIPHREPFLLIDRIEELQPGLRVVAFKKLTLNDSWFKGHFPNYAVQPGVLTIEMLAQAGAVCVLAEKQNLGKTAFLGGVDKARFKRQVFPGDELKLSVEVDKLKGEVGFANAVATVGEDVVVTAKLMFVVKQV